MHLICLLQLKIHHYTCFMCVHAVICLIIIAFLDINGCELATDDCDQLCVNDLGSYHCECYTGYFRDNNLSSCVG